MDDTIKPNFSRLDGIEIHARDWEAGHFEVDVRLILRDPSTGDQLHIDCHHVRDLHLTDQLGMFGYVVFEISDFGARGWERCRFSVNETEHDVVRLLCEDVTIHPPCASANVA